MSMNMQPPAPGTRHGAPPRRKRRHRNEPAAPPDPANLYLAALDVEICVSDALNRPLVSELLVEDLWWRAARDEWLSRRPGWFERSRRAIWCHEGAHLDEKRDRIRQLAAEQGIVAKPRSKPAKQHRRNAPA